MGKFLKLFGNKIRYYRKLRGWSQEFLAEKTDVSMKTISQWENGKVFPTQQNLSVLCKIFNITEEDLFSFISSDISKSSTTLDEIIRISKQLTPIQQKQVVTIVKSFLE